MLAAGTAPPGDLDGYLLEPKWDGVRLIVTVHDGTVRLVTRNARDVSSHYPELAGLAAALRGRSAVLDGEVVTFDERGRTSFQKLQKRMHVANPGPELAAAVPVEFMAFDLLWLDGELLTGLRQRERRRRLEELAPEGPSWHLTPLLAPAPVDELLRACSEVGLEGYVIKRGGAAYLPGRRSSAWVKLKCIKRRELVVGGWVPGRGGRSGSVGSLAVGIHGLDRGNDDRHERGLRFMGSVGSGLTDDWIRQLTAVVARLGSDDSPFVEHVVGVHFLEPRLVAEVAYTRVTDSGTLRHPTLQGFRTDLDPCQVVADEALQEAFDRRPATMRIRA